MAHVEKQGVQSIYRPTKGRDIYKYNVKQLAVVKKFLELTHLAICWKRTSWNWSTVIPYYS